MHTQKMYNPWIVGNMLIKSMASDAQSAMHEKHGLGAFMHQFSYTDNVCFRNLFASYMRKRMHSCVSDGGEPKLETNTPTPLFYINTSTLPFKQEHTPLDYCNILKTTHPLPFST